MTGDDVRVATEVLVQEREKSVCLSCCEEVVPIEWLLQELTELRTPNRDQARAARCKESTRFRDGMVIDL